MLLDSAEDLLAGGNGQRGKEILGRTKGKSVRTRYSPKGEQGRDDKMEDVEER